MLVDEYIKAGELFELGFRTKAFEILGKPKKVLSKENFKRGLKKLNRKKEINTETAPKDLSKLTKVGEVAAKFILKELELSGVLPNLFTVDCYNRIALKEKDETGLYHNADFLFSVNEEKLFIFELTLGGGISFHKEITDVGKELDSKKIKSLFSGVGIEINYWETDFIEFVKSVIKEIEQQKSRGTFWTEEITKAVQALTYALSFLKEVGYRKEVYVRVVYPFKEGLKGLFEVKENYKEEVDKLYEKMREIYSRLKREVSPLEQDENYWKNKLKELCSKPYEITIPEEYRIEKVRNSVADITLKAKTGKICFLLHPAGSGKTTGVLNRFLKRIEEERPALLFLFAPRRKIVEDKRKGLLEKLPKDIVEVIEDTKETNLSHKELKGYSQSNREKGRLNSIKERFFKSLNNTKKMFFAVLTTTQAITNTTYNYNTAKNIFDMVRAFLIKYENGEIIVAVDEILGTDGGFLAVKDIAEYLIDYKNQTVIFAMDANLLCGKVLEKITEKFLKMKEIKETIIPECLIKITGDEILKSLNQSIPTLKEFFNWEVDAYSIPSFPTKEKVKLIFDYAIIGKKEKKEDKILEKLEELGLKTYCYIQDKLTADKLREKLKEKGYRVVLHTALIREGNNIKEADYTISTSSMSRGVDVPYSKALILIPLFGLETQSAETYQASSRIRDKEENTDKTLHYYLLWKEEEAEEELKKSNTENWNSEKIRKKARTYALVRAYKILSYEKKKMKAFIRPERGETYYIPIPKIRPHLTGGSTLSKVIELMELSRRVINPEFPDKVFHFDIKSQEDYAISYPFKIDKAYCYCRIKKSGLSQLKRKIEENKRKIQDKANEYLKFIDEIIYRNKGTLSDYKIKLNNVYVAFHIPTSEVYSDFIKKRKRQTFKVSFSTLGRLELSIVKGTAFIPEDGKLYFFVPEVFIEKKYLLKNIRFILKYLLSY